MEYSEDDECAIAEIIKILEFENKSDLNPFSLFSKTWTRNLGFIFQPVFFTAIFSPHLQQEPELYEKISHVAI